MAKKAEKRTVDRDFPFASDAELDERIRAFAREHEAATGERLAMDARRSLGPGKARITFRVVEPKGGRR